MILAEFSDASDVYVFEDMPNVICCSTCHLDENRASQRFTPARMVGHLRAHREAGHKVPTGLTKAVRDLE